MKKRRLFAPGKYKAPPELASVRPESVLEQLVAKPLYRELAQHPRRWNHRKRMQYDLGAREQQRLLDHRTPQEREKAIYGEWYPFLIAIRAEEANARRVAKAQATLKWRKEHNDGK